MIRLASLTIGAVLIGTAPTTATLDPDSPLAFRIAEASRTAFGTAPVADQRPRQGRSQASRDQARAIVANIAAERLGHAWVPVALKIAHVESRFNCGAVGPALSDGRSAMGLMQVRPTSAWAMGYTGTAAGLRDCYIGAVWGVEHMRKCIASGANDEASMARCHVGGAGALRKRLKPWAERYAQRYRHMVAQAPAIPDAAGWLVRGTTSTLIERGV
jgi:soluble lytic murein transglycosylase-like protein